MHLFFGFVIRWFCSYYSVFSSCLLCAIRFCFAAFVGCWLDLVVTWFFGFAWIVGGIHYFGFVVLPLFVLFFVFFCFVLLFVALLLHVVIWVLAYICFLLLVFASCVLFFAVILCGLLLFGVFFCVILVCRLLFGFGLFGPLELLFGVLQLVTWV